MGQEDRDRLNIYLLELFWDGGCEELGRGCVVGVLTVLCFLSLCLPINLLNLFTCLSFTLVYLDSLTLLMKLVHFCIVVDVTKDANLYLHLSSLSILSWRMLFIALTPS